MSQNKSRSWLKLLGLSLAAWLGMIILLNMFMCMSTDSFEMSMIKQMLPITALLSIFPTGIMVADYLRPLRTD